MSQTKMPSWCCVPGSVARRWSSSTHEPFAPANPPVPVMTSIAYGTPTLGRWADSLKVPENVEPLTVVIVNDPAPVQTAWASIVPQ